MLDRFVALILLTALMGICGGSAAGAEADTAADEEALRGAGLPADGPGLLALFRKRTPDADAQTRIKTLITQLGSDSFSEREEASEELAACGVAAVGLLRKAVHHNDLEIRRRAQDALTLIEQNDLSADVLIAALHVLGRRKPARLAEVLLAYLPHAVDADIIEELGLALASAAKRDGDADPLLVQTLTDKSPIKRAIAGAALCRGGCRKQFPAVRRLLRDSDLQVRRRVALALLEARDKAAVPVLIELLAELPIVQGEHVESMLLQVAGERAPKGSLDDQGDAGPAARGKYRDAWAEWWKQHGDGLDLAKVELLPHWRGYTLALCMTTVRGRGVVRSGSILELDAQGRTRWQLKGLDYPVDAQIINERRVLVTEYRSGQVTERNHNGDILHRINVSGRPPLEARRLPNGNTFVVTRGQVMEVDRAGKEVWKVSPRISIAAASPLPRGQVAICAVTGGFYRFDRTGKVLAEADIARRFRTSGTHLHALPNGHVLVPLYYDNKVVEVDKNGSEVWSASYPRPVCAQRLPNGRTLVASYGSNVFAELDKKGQEVKRQQVNAPLMFVSGR